MPDDLDALAAALAQAEADHAADIAALDGLDDAQLDYLARAHQLADAHTDGIEGHCV